MPRHCVICNHPDKEEIEKLILEGISYSKIILKYADLNKANISRHKRNHLNWWGELGVH